MVATMGDDVVVVAEDAVGEPVVPHELPDVLHDVQLRAFRRQRQQGDVVWHCEIGGEVPACLIQQQHGMLSGADRAADLGQVQGHARGVAGGQDQGGALAVLRADSAVDIG